MSYLTSDAPAVSGWCYVCIDELIAKAEAMPRPGAAVSGPCSPCGDGDTAMKFHRHAAVDDSLEWVDEAPPERLRLFLHDGKVSRLWYCDVVAPGPHEIIYVRDRPGSAAVAETQGIRCPDCGRYFHEPDTCEVNEIRIREYIQNTVANLSERDRASYIDALFRKTQPVPAEGVQELLARERLRLAFAMKPKEWHFDCASERDTMLALLFLPDCTCLAVGNASATEYQHHHDTCPVYIQVRAALAEQQNQTEGERKKG